MGRNRVWNPVPPTRNGHGRCAKEKKVAKKKKEYILSLSPYKGAI